MRLIIAEKHSVGQAIAQAVGGHAEKHDGYIQVGGDLVTWAQGHLVDLAAPDEYKNHDWGKWSLDTLPIDPTPGWQWKVSRDKGADRKGKQLRSTEQGRSLIDVVATKLKDVALTAGMERRLSEVEHNHADPAQVETEFRDLAVRIPADAQTAVRQDHVQTKTRNTESFGPCPRCGKPVIKTGKVFQCSTNRREKQSDGTWRTTEGCGWRAWTTVAGKTVTDSAIRRLLAGRKVSLKGFTSKKGSKFDASLVVDKDRGVIFDFGNKH